MPGNFEVSLGGVVRYEEGAAVALLVAILTIMQLQLTEVRGVWSRNVG